jgi:hypothetical protein
MSTKRLKTSETKSKDVAVASSKEVKSESKDKTTTTTSKQFDRFILTTTITLDDLLQEINEVLSKHDDISEIVEAFDVYKAMSYGLKLDRNYRENSEAFELYDAHIHLDNVLDDLDSRAQKVDRDDEAAVQRFKGLLLGNVRRAMELLV